jgi:deoxyribonuclease V
MLCCVDVEYRTTCVVAACVGFRDWRDDAPAFEQVAVTRGAAAPYESGQFYRRELPHLIEVLGQLVALPQVVIVDGHVWLGPGIPGLGAHLHEALGRRAAIVGIAKRPFHGASEAVPVLRGDSKTPLLVSVVGLATEVAARHVASMHGAFRIPTLIKAVDRLSRDHRVELE